ncbi:hypothetical protein FOA52_014527 [Chlamydomonas sp. UWO 241]|nr:hypothetical protein FOA52_014527 [Chlamydomonas sp. UWO 241]
MTVQSVDAALAPVRPYLRSDGGDVEVVDVVGGVVLLRMTGACTSCAQSATTMRLGVEAALRRAFEDELKDVVEVGGGEARPTSAKDVNAHLDAVRDALTKLGGKVDAVDVKQGTCVLKYRGPAGMGDGIAKAIRATFRDISDVIVVPF